MSPHFHIVVSLNETLQLVSSDQVIFSSVLSDFIVSPDSRGKEEHQKEIKRGTNVTETLILGVSVQMCDSVKTNLRTYLKIDFLRRKR